MSALQNYIPPTITDYNNLTMQPENIIITLKVHQLALLKKMLKIEKRKTVFGESDDRINYIISNVGILGDPVGSGKSLVILALIAASPLVKYITLNNKTLTAIQNICEFKYNNVVYKNLCIPTTKQHYVKYPCSLLIIPDIICNQWEQYLKYQTKLKYHIITDTVLNYVSISNVLVVTELILPNVIEELSSITFSRIIIDEADSINIQFNYMVKLRSAFTWLVTATFNGCGKNVASRYLNGVPYSYTLFHNNYILVNDYKVVQQYMSIPDYLYKKCIIKHFVNDVIGGLVNDDVISYLNINCLDKALIKLDENKYGEKNIIFLLFKNLNYKLKKYKNDGRIWTINLEYKLKTLKERITKIKDCILCLSSVEENPLILKCCGGRCCKNCIEAWFRRNTCCPYCKAKISIKYIVEGEKGIKTYVNKIDYIKYILLPEACGAGSSVQRKFLIFSEYSESFDNIQNLLLKLNIDFKLFDTTQVMGEMPPTVSLLNINDYGAGINMTFATDIIICHRVLNSMLHQIIGRAQRLDRTSQLRVWYLLYDNEGEYCKYY